MAKATLTLNSHGNEAVSKFKLLTSYGGPGSLVHTEYGSIMISCIEEWGFLKKLDLLINQASQQNGMSEDAYVRQQAKFSGLQLSYDTRLLRKISKLKSLNNLKFLCLIPDIELKERFNVIKSGLTDMAISSTYFPKGFSTGFGQHKTYQQWYKLWRGDTNRFFPPKYALPGSQSGKTENLRQDNLAMICPKGHISDIPWSKLLRWRIDHPHDLHQPFHLFDEQNCCNSPDIVIKEASANASGFEGKWVKCTNQGCQYRNGTSLKGITSLKIICPGHKPWEAATGQASNHFGDNSARESRPPYEVCGSMDTKVVLTTGNNLTFARVFSSIFLPDDVFLDERVLRIQEAERRVGEASAARRWDECRVLEEEITTLKGSLDEEQSEPSTDAQFRHQEYKALRDRTEAEINLHPDKLKVQDVTSNLSAKLRQYFFRILRLDNLMVTSAQMDFSRVEPVSADNAAITGQNIFRSLPHMVQSYPVVENHGEGIMFILHEDMIENWVMDGNRFSQMIERERNPIAQASQDQGRQGGWQLFAVHSLSHLIMRELEFRCGYPTASLSERLYVSNDPSTRMYGLMIYTAEGAEGSMGGLIAQTRQTNLNQLIESALKRATVCNSDPLCWKSEGQGLFELNLASCFSCSLVSETSCEHRNIFLDRRVVIDEEFGLFREVIS